MRAPISWLAEHADIPAGTTPRQVAEALIRVGLEVESVESGAEGLSGPVVVGRVLSFADEPQKNGKVIRWCQVDVGAHNNQDGTPRGIVCGAHNFAPGDLVVVSLPGAVLPGGFAIAARKTYGHISDGMICSVRELGIGDDHGDLPGSQAPLDGILVLPANSAQPGDDPLALLGLDDAVLDVAVTTDRGYCLSIRGLAREVAAAFGTAFHDVTADLPPADRAAHEVLIDDPTCCDRFSVRVVTGLDPSAPTPEWMVRRLRQCGVRSISLAVDVTNYVMIETGQPLHAFDRALVRGALHARRARPGETLETLDHVRRTLDERDTVVADDSGPVALGGVMGGASTEIHDGSSEIVLEAAHWNPSAVAQTSRRHKLTSEASRRLERDVDPEIAGVALARAVDLLVEYGGATAAPGYTVAIADESVPPLIAMGVQRAAELAGTAIDREHVVATLETVGCTVDGGDVLQVRPPTWRPDLLIAADLVEEVVRLVGYDTIPSVLPSPPAGTGLTDRQRFTRAVSRALAGAGLTEVLSFPFVPADAADTLGLPADDVRRRAARLVNPLSADEPDLRTTLLPGLLATAVRNVGRGNRDLALFETGLVFLPPTGAAKAPAPGVERRPSDAELAAIDAAIPVQPRHVAAVFAGNATPRGWWGDGRPADWTDAVEAARTIARSARAELTVRAADVAPWHPGRCAELLLGDTTVGYAGELNPRVVAALGLPARTCAVEVDLDAFPAPGPAVAPTISSYPPVLLDVSLVVAENVPSAALLAAVRDGAGELLESVDLFDVYRDAGRLGPDLKSLTFALQFRADDRTLTVEEATAARDRAVASAADRTGATLRA